MLQLTGVWAQGVQEVVVDRVVGAATAAVEAVAADHRITHPSHSLSGRNDRKCTTCKTASI